MEAYIWFALIALLAAAVVFVILRIIVSFVRAVPKWLYALAIFVVICGVAVVFFGTTIIQTFGP